MRQIGHKPDIDTRQPNAYNKPNKGGAALNTGTIEVFDWVLQHGTAEDVIYLVNHGVDYVKAISFGVYVDLPNFSFIVNDLLNNEQYRELDITKTLHKLLKTKNP